MQRIGRLVNSVREPLYKQVGIIGLPTNLGQTEPGVKYGPAAVRTSGLFESVEAMGIKLVDYGDVPLLGEKFPDPPQHRLRHPRTHASNAMMISDAVSSVLAAGRDSLLLCVGGDHSLSLGTVHGHSRVNHNLALLWIDAHADCNTSLTSPSGNVHGMPLSFLLREQQKYVPRIPAFDSIGPCLSFKDVAFIGLRDVDSGERYFLEKYGVHVYGMQEVDRLGLQEVLSRSLDRLNPNGTRPLHLSFDIDSLDPGIATSTGTPVPAGLTLREGLYIAEEVHKTGCLKVVDLTEVNPHLGNDEQRNLTVHAAKEVIRACLGWQRAGLLPSNFVLPTPEDFQAESRSSLLNETKDEMADGREEEGGISRG